MATAKNKKLDRIELRVSNEDKAKIQRAVSFLKVSTTQFVMDKIMPDVERALAEEERIALDNKAWVGFVSLLENPKPASTSLKSAMQEYRKSQEV